MLMKLVPGWRWSIHAVKFRWNLYPRFGKCNIVIHEISSNGLSSFPFNEKKKKKKTEIDWAIQITSHPFFPEGNIQTCHDLQRNQILNWKTVLQYLYTHKCTWSYSFLILNDTKYNWILIEWLYKCYTKYLYFFVATRRKMQQWIPGRNRDENWIEYAAR